VVVLKKDKIIFINYLAQRLLSYVSGLESFSKNMKSDGTSSKLLNIDQPLFHVFVYQKQDKNAPKEK
jgi:hypothetical protein